MTEPHDPTKPSGAERRTSRRAIYPCEARCFALGIDLPRTHLLDLSLGGAFIETEIEMPEGTVLLLRFELSGYHMKLEGEVVRIVPAHGLAVRFVDLRPSQRAAIERFLTEAA
jgi:hypothetical protein